MDADIPSPQLRWQRADLPEPQLRLLDKATRRIGRGEYRGLEFLEVEAKRLINTLPPGGPLPFRHTINVYRGCSHGCSYCLSGDTPVLMSDGTTKPLEHLRPGDLVFGTVRDGSYRRYVHTEVLAHWSTTKPAYRVTLADGTQLIASGDHRFLTNRGWKHVVGAEQGANRRPHLTTNNRLMGTGAFAAQPAVTAAYRRGYLCGMIRGDGSIGRYAYPRNGRRGEVYRFRLALVDAQALHRTRGYLEGEGIVTRLFQFSAGDHNHKPLEAIRTQKRAHIEAIERLVSWPDEANDDWSKGFLAGVFDAEGSHSRGILRVSNGDPSILRQIEGCLRRFGFSCVVEPASPNGGTNIRVPGGIAEHLRFFHTVDPAISRKRSLVGTAVKHPPRLRVVAIEPLGLELPMFDITTGTGDFIANGVISHNCFARPTHEYLGLGIGEDFDTKIVVKVNAVERARHETAPSRWAAEPIAMGTNTDPYQAAEGKYKLTRGIVETLAERRNPFSILTKSSLVVRDLDVLAEAAAHTEVAVDFSVGTLDDEVWRLTEPGTPHPMRRIEAVAKLNQAGVPSGVLMGPVLPGMSDDEAGIETVVEAALDAGAVRVGAVLLHLKPGLKDHYLGFLETKRPDLVEMHRRRYANRSYAAKNDQQELTDLVRRLVARHGGLGISPRPRPKPNRPRPTPRADQLSLFSP